MVRVKRGVIAHKKREKLLKYAKGFRWGRKSKERLAREALLHAWSHAFVGRKRKKRDMRRLWQIKINAAARMHDMSYSAFLALLKKKNVELDRKILAELAEHHPHAFAKIIESAR
ncbi:MAG: 50S ribosomal protein L20 [Candidatus Colwellbacteria bacterium]|nr:50S ribosomal protein L20 [Candidatus Colwellbacteria bacterium]